RAFGSVCASGELGLDGGIKPCGGLTRAADAAWKEGCEALFVSLKEETEARAALQLIARAGGHPAARPRVIGVSTLAEAWDAFRDPPPDRGEIRDVEENLPEPAFPPGLLPLGRG